MNKIFTFLLFLCCCFSQTQGITFSYDDAGNQIQRLYCFGCADKTSNTKEITALEDEDLQKIFTEDLILLSQSCKGKTVS
jgi:hypothetical protein